MLTTPASASSVPLPTAADIESAYGGAPAPEALASRTAGAQAASEAVDQLGVQIRQLLTLREAARLLPRRRRGRPMHVATLHRWATHGLRGVRLETVQVGGARCTTREALQRFFERLADPVPAPTKETPSARQLAVERAEEELDAIGI